MREQEFREVVARPADVARENAGSFRDSVVGPQPDIRAVHPTPHSTVLPIEIAPRQKVQIRKDSPVPIAVTDVPQQEQVKKGTDRPTLTQEEFMTHVQEEMGFLAGRAYNLSDNSYDADDLVQTTLLNAWQSRDSFTPGTNFGGWLNRICTNASASAYRQRENSRGTIVPVDPSHHEKGARTIRYMPYKEPIGDANNEVTYAERVRENAAELPIADEYVDAVVLADVLGLKYDEIAALREVPVGTVRSRINRGRTGLSNLGPSVVRDVGRIPTNPKQEDTT